MEKTHWEDWAILALGVWLALSPLFMPYGSLTDAAAWNSYIVGGAAAIFAVSTITSIEKWADWVNLLLGVWLVGAPFALGFYAAQEVAAWNHIVVGILIAASAIWALASGSAIQTHVHKH